MWRCKDEGGHANIIYLFKFHGNIYLRLLSRYIHEPINWTDNYESTGEKGSGPDSTGQNRVTVT